jgi:hypothetical protein
MSYEQVLDRYRIRTRPLAILEVFALFVVCGKMASDYRQGSGLDGLLVGTPMLGVLLGLWIVHKQFVRKLGESVTDAVAFDQLALIADRLELLVIVAVFFAMGTLKWFLHGLF